MQRPFAGEGSNETNECERFSGSLSSSIISYKHDDGKDLNRTLRQVVRSRCKVLSPSSPRPNSQAL